ncbi:hypothetical protein ACL9RL_02555 [Plantibacter sp. Mn2098]|uniref:hypothetical protein n=1 Tax=Plantibacter sp. Mn2098 TaxID=3395266 RepID=UPI003BD07024
MDRAAEEIEDFERVLARELTALRVRGIGHIDAHRSGSLPIPYLRRIAALWSMRDTASREDLRTMLEAATQGLEPQTAEVVEVLFGLGEWRYASHTPRTLLDEAYKLPGFAHSAERSRERRRYELTAELAEQIVGMVDTLTNAKHLDFLDGGLKRGYADEASVETRYQLGQLRAQILALYQAAERWQLMPWWRVPARIQFVTALVARVLVVDHTIQHELDNPFAPPSFLVRRASVLLGSRVNDRRRWERMYALSGSLDWVNRYGLLQRRLWLWFPLRMFGLYRQLSPKRPLRAPGFGVESEDLRVALVWQVYKWAAQMGTADELPSHELTQELTDFLMMRERGARRWLERDMDRADFELLQFRRPKESPVVSVPLLDDGDLARRIDLLWADAESAWLKQLKSSFGPAPDSSKDDQ